MEREAFDLPVSFKLNFDIDESEELNVVNNTFAYSYDLLSNVSLTIDGVFYSATDANRSYYIRQQAITNDSSLWMAQLFDLEFSDRLPDPAVRINEGTAYEELIDEWVHSDININLTDLDGDIYAETISNLITLNDSDFETKEISISWQHQGFELTNYNITGNIDTIMTVVPLPTTVWLFGSGLIGFGRRQRR